MNKNEINHQNHLLKIEEKTKEAEEEITKPTDSGNKLIPERFSACECIPKTSKSGNLRDRVSSCVENF